MDELGATRVVPELRDEDRDMEVLRLGRPGELQPGYLMRSMHLMPKRLDKPEWRHTQDYWTEREVLPALSPDDDCLVYS